jgi:hypothetical protein
MFNKTTYYNVFVFVIISSVVLAMSAPIPQPYDPSLDSFDRVNSVEEIECLDWEDCLEIFGMSPEKPEISTYDKSDSPCVVICNNKYENDLFRCDMEFTILSAINRDMVANYTMNYNLITTQIKRVANFITRFMDINEYDIPIAVMKSAMKQITGHMAEMREIILNVEHYFMEVERNSECSGLLDMWLGRRILKMFGLL